MDQMRTFTLRGMEFSLPETAVRGGLGKALASGRYEHTEADAVERHLVEGDRFADFGAGMGYLCALAARRIGAVAVTGVEAGPKTIRLARKNLRENGFGKVRLIHGAVTGEGETAAEVEFCQRQAFWASSLRNLVQRAGRDLPQSVPVTQVPALPAARLLDELQPTVLSCDIEGAELEVLRADMPAALRLIICEIHPALYGPEGTRQIFDALARQGFAYEPEGSRGATVVFRRIGSP